MKKMTCYRCFNQYSSDEAKMVKVKRLANKQPACPKCECMVYV